jgi:Transposase DDE domain
LGGPTPAQPRVDRANPGSKLHLAADNNRRPLALLGTAATTNDSTMFEALLDDLPAVRTPAGGRRCRPEKVHADKAYDQRRCRAYLTRRGIRVRIARCGIGSSERLGRHRWKTVTLTLRRRSPYPPMQPAAADGRQAQPVGSHGGHAIIMAAVQ